LEPETFRTNRKEGATEKPKFGQD